MNESLLNQAKELFEHTISPALFEDFEFHSETELIEIIDYLITRLQSLKTP